MIVPRNQTTPPAFDSTFDPRIHEVKEIMRRARTPAIDLALMHFVTKDPRMLAMKSLVRQLSIERDPILIQGPTGTGKEIIATALSKGMPDSKLFAINCGALPATIIHSILFGHKRGAFTGAVEDYAGVLVEAHQTRATVFLDEIGKMPLELQGLLLRALENKQVTPVGSTKEVSIADCRFIAAARENLIEMVDKGTFLEDLYGRLYTHEVHITGLRERPDDINFIARSMGFEEPIPVDERTFGTNIYRFNVRGIIAYIKRQAML